MILVQGYLLLRNSQILSEIQIGFMSCYHIENIPRAGLVARLRGCVTVLWLSLGPKRNSQLNELFESACDLHKLLLNALLRSPPVLSLDLRELKVQYPEIVQSHTVGTPPHQELGGFQSC